MAGLSPTVRTGARQTILPKIKQTITPMYLMELGWWVDLASSALTSVMAPQTSIQPSHSSQILKVTLGAEAKRASVSVEPFTCTRESQHASTNPVPQGQPTRQSKRPAPPEHLLHCILTLSNLLSAPSSRRKASQAIHQLPAWLFGTDSSFRTS